MLAVAQMPKKVDENKANKKKEKETKQKKEVYKEKQSKK